MISFFKEKSASAVILLVIVSAGTRALFWINPPQLVTARGDGFIYFALSPLSAIPVLVMPLLYHLIVIIQALRINYALNDLRLFPKSAYTTAVAYVLLTGIIPGWNNISSALIANSMVIWLLYRIMKLYTTQKPNTLLYNIGLITSCTVLLYFPSFPLIIIVFFTLAIYRPFKPTEWMILLLGIITPAYFLAGWLFLNNKIGVGIKQLKMFQPHFIHADNLLLTAITLGFAGLIILAGMYLWQANSNRMVIQVRKSWTILFVMFILLIPTVFFTKNGWPSALLVAAIPGSAFVSNVFIYPRKNLFPALLFWVFAALIIYNSWFVAKF